MRMSVWSSDVCSSDLVGVVAGLDPEGRVRLAALELQQLQAPLGPRQAVVRQVSDEPRLVEAVRIGHRAERRHRSARHHGSPIVRPPSAPLVWPVIKDAASEARKAERAAIYTGSPMRYRRVIPPLT